MTIKEILFGLILVFMAFTAVQCCLKDRDKCIQPQYQNTLQQDIHRDGPCEHSEEK